ncbi:hypothetical protein EBR04_11270 [bacterium]|nr:hypothetical protein [bacterium]
MIFYADDLGWGELGCQGNPEIPTPHIDSLAANGVRCTQGYVAATYCSPSRAGLMTGRYPTRFGHEVNGDHDSSGDARHAAQGPRLRHRLRRQVAPRHLARTAADGSRLRRVFRHARQHALLPSDAVHRLAQVARRGEGRGRRLLHDRRLRRPGRGLDREARIQPLVSLPAVQRPACTAPGATKIPRSLQVDPERKTTHVRGDALGDGRRRRPRARDGEETRSGGEHDHVLHRRQRRPDRAHDVPERPAPRLQDDDVRGRPAGAVPHPVEGPHPRRKDLRPAGDEPRRRADGDGGRREARDGR